MNIKQVAMTLLFAGLAVLAVSSQFLAGQETTALVLGFFIFSLNIMAMSLLAGLIIKASKGELPKGKKVVALILGFVKFIVLAAGLYVGLVYLDLPGIYFGVGALLALVSVLWNFTTSYLKSLNQLES